MSSYIQAVYRAMQIIIQTNNFIARQDGFAVINAVYAPRSLGGWGIPTLMSWLSQESKDPLSNYIYTICSLVDNLKITNPSHVLVALATGTLNQPLKEMSFDDITGAPRSVKSATVRDPTATIMRTIKSGMKRRCKSRIFAAMLGVGSSRECKQFMLDAVKSCNWDASVLEIFGQTLPAAHAAALVDRAYKNEMVTQLFPLAVRSRLSKNLVRNNATAVAHTFYLADNSNSYVFSRQTAFDIAHGLREMYYANSRIDTHNHTLPDYTSCFARREQAYESCITAVSDIPSESCPSEGYRYSSMYDGMVPGERSVPGRSKSVYTFTGDRYAGVSTLKKCISKLSILSSFVSKSGGNGKFIWDVGMLSWGAKTAIEPPIVLQKVVEGVSSKRMSSKTSHITHEISHFKNVQGIIRIDDQGIGRHLTAHSLHVDYMSFVTPLRSLALIAVSFLTSRKAIKDFHLNYAVLPGTFPPTSPVLCNVMDDALATSSLSGVRDTSDPTLFSDFMREMEMPDVAIGVDDEFIAIAYSEHQLDVISSRIVIEGRVEPGFVINSLRSGVIVPAATRHKAVSRSAQGDEPRFSVIHAADSRLRKYGSSTGASHAVFAVMLEQVLVLFPREMCIEVMSVPLSQSHISFETRFPTWGTQWANLIGWARRHVPRLNDDMVANLFPRAVTWDGPKMSLSRLSVGAGNGALRAMTVLYRTAHGRPANRESYTATAILGSDHAARCWKTAAVVRKSRFGTPTIERRMHAEVYEHASAAAAAFTTKGDIANSFKMGLHSIVTGLQTRKYGSFIPNALRSRRAMDNMFDRINDLQVPSEALSATDRRHPLIMGYISRCANILQDLCLKPSMIFFQELMDDICAIGNPTILRDDQKLLYVGDVDTTVRRMDLPTFTGLVIQDSDFSSMEVDRGADEDTRDGMSRPLRLAVAAFCEGRSMEECMAIESGDLDYESWMEEEELPLESREELEEPGEPERVQPAPRRRRRGRRSGRLVRERLIAALIQRWRPI